MPTTNKQGNMKDFFKMFFASLTAIVVSGLLLGFIFFTVIVSFTLSAMKEPQVQVPKNSVLVINVESLGGDKLEESPFAYIDFNTMEMRRPVTTLQAVTAVKCAAQDDNIGAILILSQPNYNVGLPQVYELREALMAFKDSGKKIYSYGRNFTQKNYYLASVSDKIFMNPAGMFEWVGVSMQSVFFKDMLDKIGIDIKAIRHGKYKSAVETFTMDGMSQESKEQYEAIVSAMWSEIVNGVSKERGIASEVLDGYAQNLSICFPTDAVAANLVDSLLYGDQVEEFIKGANNGEYKTVSLANYASAVSAGSKTKGSKGDIALIIAEGDIAEGPNTPGTAGEKSLVEQIRAAGKDSKIKAVVLRVNSPGGGLLPSETLCHEVEMLQKQKPVIASFGNVAASGGYYMSCMADVIVTDPTTLTGSIGVFGLSIDLSKALNDKLGINVDIIKSNRYADITTPFRPMSKTEEIFMQKNVDESYRHFVSKVAQGRNLTFEQVDAVAQGRVWSGTDAVEHGLADGLGGLDDAIAIAAERAGIADSYNLRNMQSSRSPFFSLFDMQSVAKAWSSAKRPLLKNSTLIEDFEYAARMAGDNSTQAVLPYRIEFR